MPYDYLTLRKQYVVSIFLLVLMHFSLLNVTFKLLLLHLKYFFKSLWNINECLQPRWNSHNPENNPVSNFYAGINIVIFDFWIFRELLLQKLFWEESSLFSPKITKKVLVFITQPIPKSGLHQSVSHSILQVGFD